MAGQVRRFANASVALFLEKTACTLVPLCRTLWRPRHVYGATRCCNCCKRDNNERSYSLVPFTRSLITSVSASDTLRRAVTVGGILCRNACATYRSLPTSGLLLTCSLPRGMRHRIRHEPQSEHPIGHGKHAKVIGCLARCLTN